MSRDLDGGAIAVFVSGHTHAPALAAFQRAAGAAGVLTNSGCWLRQLRPVPAHLHGRDREAPRPLRLPLPVGGLPDATGADLDAIGDHERRVEPHPELAEAHIVGARLGLSGERL